MKSATLRAATACAAATLAIVLWSAGSRAADFTDLDKTLREISKSGKPGFVVFHNGTKTKFESGLDDADIQKLMPKFVSARINVAGKKEMMERFRIDGAKLPTILFLGPGGLDLGGGIECTDPKRALVGKRFTAVMQKALKGYPNKLKPILADKIANLSKAPTAEQIAIINVVGDTKNKEAAAGLATLLANPSTEKTVKIACIGALASLDDPEHWPAVVRAVQDKDRLVAKAAQQTFADGTGIKHLLAGLNDEKPEVRSAVAIAIRQLFGSEPDAKSPTFWRTGTAEEREAHLKVLTEHVEKKTAKKP